MKKNNQLSENYQNKDPRLEFKKTFFLPKVNRIMNDAGWKWYDWSILDAKRNNEVPKFRIQCESEFVAPNLVN